MSARYRWYLVGMLWWVSFFNYADRQAIFSVFPLLEQELHLDEVQLGLLGSAFAWVYGLAGPLAGAVVDRVKRKTAILAGLQIWSTICALTAWSRTFSQLLLFRGAEGLGESVYYPASMSLLADYHGRTTRSRAMALHQTSVYAGTIGGGFFAGAIAAHYGWRQSFVVFGALGILLGLILSRALKEPERGAMDPANSETRLSVRDTIRLLAAKPTILLLMAAFVCANFVAVVLLSWMPKFIYDRFHFSLAAAGLTATVFVQAASMAGSPLGGWAADRLRGRTARGRIAVQLAGVVAGAPFVAWCGLTHSAPWLAAALTVWGFCKGLYDGNLWAALFDVVPARDRGTIAGIMNAAGWLGGGSAPVLVGLVAKYRGLGTAIALTSLVYCAAAVFLAIAMMRFIGRDALEAEPQ